jgi:hypothetical protein
MNVALKISVDWTKIECISMDNRHAEDIEIYNLTPYDALSAME